MMMELKSSLDVAQEESEGLLSANRELFELNSVEEGNSNHDVNMETSACYMEMQTLITEYVLGADRDAKCILEIGLQFESLDSEQAMEIERK